MGRRKSLLGVSPDRSRVCDPDRSRVCDYAGGLAEQSTAFAGAGLLVEVYRQAGVQAVAERALPAKRHPKGLGHGQMVEAFVLLSALGGECLDDMERLRQDPGLAALLRYTPPAPETARSGWTGSMTRRSWRTGPPRGPFCPRNRRDLGDPDTSG